MKPIETYDWWLDEGVYIFKTDKDGKIIEDDNKEPVEIDDDTPLTYGMFKDLLEQLTDNLKSDLKDIVDMIE